MSVVDIYEHVARQLGAAAPKGFASSSQIGGKAGVKAGAEGQLPLVAKATGESFSGPDLTVRPRRERRRPFGTARRNISATYRSPRLLAEREDVDELADVAGG